MVWEYDAPLYVLQIDRHNCKLTGIKNMLDKVFTKVTNIKKIFVRVLLPQFCIKKTLDIDKQIIVITYGKSIYVPLDHPIKNVKNNFGQ